MFKDALWFPRYLTGTPQWEEVMVTGRFVQPWLYPWATTQDGELTHTVSAGGLPVNR